LPHLRRLNIAHDMICSFCKHEMVLMMMLLIAET
jgi:hypothetical protein